MKEVFEFDWEDFEDENLLIKVNNYEEQVQCIDFIANHCNVDKEYVNYQDYEEDWSYIISSKWCKNRWSRIHVDDLGEDDIYIEFKNIKQEESETSNKKEFDWDGFKSEEFDVVLKSSEEANSFFNEMYDKYNIEYRTDYDEYFDFIERDSVFITYSEYEDDGWDWSNTQFTDKIVNWSDYMDKKNTTGTLKDTLGKSSVERALDSNVYNKIDNSQQDIKQAFVDIDTSVLYKTRELFDTIRDEKDIEKIRNTLNIIDRLVITKNKVLNDFDSCMIDELNKE